MDIEEFEKRVQPRSKRSKLEPFRAQIFELKAKGYADWQVRDWLAENGLAVSRQAVQLYVATRKGGAAGTSITTTAKPIRNLDVEQPAIPNENEASGITGGKLNSEAILEAPSKSYSFKQINKAKETK